MRYYEKDGFAVPEKYLKMSLKQLERRCKTREKVYTIISKIIPSTKKKVKTNIKFNF